MSLLISSLLLSSLGVLAGCSSKKDVTVSPAGEKVPVGPLTYSVIDTEVLPKLGDDPATARTPKDRFYLITIAISNARNDDASIPGLNLVDDSGHEYAELADGADVPNWLGVLRKVAGNQTERGNIVFDAPAQHYKLRLTEETDPKQVFIDVPLNYLHEQLRDSAQTPSDSAQTPIAAPKTNK
jgi:hypothetical protein